MHHLEKENQKLRRFVADPGLNKAMLSPGNFLESGAGGRNRTDTLSPELDFEGSRVYKKRRRCCSPVLQQIPISMIHAPVPHLVQRKCHRPMCTL